MTQERDAGVASVDASGNEEQRQRKERKKEEDVEVECKVGKVVGDRFGAVKLGTSTSAFRENVVEDRVERYKGELAISESVDGKDGAGDEGGEDRSTDSSGPPCHGPVGVFALGDDVVASEEELFENKGSGQDDRKRPAKDGTGSKGACCQEERSALKGRCEGVDSTEGSDDGSRAG